MPDEPTSPAVKSLLSEQAEQSVTGNTQLQRELEETFPASDPPSIIRSTVGVGQPGFEILPVDHSCEYARPTDDTPLVTAALSSSQHSPDEGRLWDEHAELTALRHDLARLQRTASEVAAGTRNVIQTDVQDRMASARQRVVDMPLTAVAIAAAVGYIFALTR